MMMPTRPSTIFSIARVFRSIVERPVGVVMINFGSAFLDQKTSDWFKAASGKLGPTYSQLRQKHKNDPAAFAAAATALWKQAGTPPRAQWTKAVEHIEHVIRIAGEDAVGLGTDYDGIEDPPIGLEDVSLLPKLTEELLRRGHSEARVKKVLGENFLRVAEATWPK